MSIRIKCYSLFDITKTGVLNRARPTDDSIDISDWYKKRNTQCNFDTILQIISLRAQPDVLNEPQFSISTKDQNLNFGTEFCNLLLPYWTFDFEVQHPAVFEDGINELGALYNDCQGVPMVYSDMQHLKVGNSLDTTELKRNIFFVKY